MRLRHRLALLVPVGVAAAALSSSAPGYYFHGVKWPDGVIRYYNAAPDQTWAVKRAVDAWNYSGARVRFIAVPRAEAQLVIEEERNEIYCSEGRASVGFAPGAHVVIFPAHGIAHSCNRYWAARVMTHELGHVLGLQHENRYCATMNAYGSLRGGSLCQPQPLWAWRCRLLEPDDVAGAVRMYGGRIRRHAANPFCPLYPAIHAPADAEVVYDAALRKLTLSFRRPSDPAIPSFAVPSPWRQKDAFAVAGPLRRCSRRDPAPDQHWRWDVPSGGIERIDVQPVSGSSCYEVWAVDKLRRPSGAPAIVTVAAP